MMSIFATSRNGLFHSCLFFVLACHHYLPLPLPAQPFYILLHVPVMISLTFQSTGVNERSCHNAGRCFRGKNTLTGGQAPSLHSVSDQTTFRLDSIPTSRSCFGLSPSSTFFNKQKCENICPFSSGRCPKSLRCDHLQGSGFWRHTCGHVTEVLELAVIKKDLCFLKVRTSHVGNRCGW